MERPGTVGERMKVIPCQSLTAATHLPEEAHPFALTLADHGFIWSLSHEEVLSDILSMPRCGVARWSRHSRMKSCSNVAEEAGSQSSWPYQATFYETGNMKNNEEQPPSREVSHSRLWELRHVTR